MAPPPDAEIFARYRELIEDWPAFEAAVARPLPTAIWTNTARVSPGQLRALLGPRIRPLAWGRGGFRAQPGFSAGHHWAYLAGLFHIQEEVSMLPVHLLEPQPGERALDLCAAPGNKTAQLSVAVGATGTVVANDRSVPRMRGCRGTFERLGLFNVSTTIGDGAGLPRSAAPFDRVLVDAPCTGEGTCRKNRPSRWRVDAETSARMAKTQLGILRNAVALCRPGGRIVYSTCTFAPEENEGVLNALLNEGAPVRVLEARVPGLSASPGLTRWAGQRLHPSLAGALRVWPHQNDSGGFFIAVLEREGALEPLGTGAEPAELPALTEERQPWLEELEARFGVSPAHFDERALVRVGPRSIYMSNRDRAPLREPTPEVIGMRLIHTTKRYPKLTTAGAMEVGPAARRNIIDLDGDQLRAFVAREACSVRGGQVGACTSTGYVILRYGGYAMGVGLYLERDGRVESLYPKGWARAVDGSGASE